MSPKNYTIESIREIVKGKLIQSCSNMVITDLTTDSRQMLNSGFLFFAIVSDRNDGHNYLEEAYNKGVRSFIVSKKIALVNLKEANIIRVDNTLRALQTLVKHHRVQFSIPVIGITGSNGKTTVKEWLYQLLQNDMKIVKSPKSYNSQIGVPLSVWKISREDELGIFEAGISKPNEMENLEKMIQPTIGVLTNLGDAHRENFTSKDEIAHEKAKLFKSCEKVVYCSDIPEMQKIASNLKRVELIAWSYKKNKKVPYVSIDKRKKSTGISVFLDSTEYKYHINFIDKASIENSISCFFVLYSINALNNNILKRMEELQSVAMRLEIKEGINSSLLINDSYNSDLQSLRIALQLLSQYKHYKNKILILSDMIQVSNSKELLYNEVAKMVRERGVELFVGIGDDLTSYRDLFSLNSLFYNDTKQFLEKFDTDLCQGSAILIKGAREFHLEKISEMLQQKSHETILEINLNAAVENLNYFRSLLKQNTKIMAMVKAFSYGAGSSEIANVLQFHQVDYLGVAYTDEGVSLRKAGINIPIMVMNPEFESFESMIRNQLEPEIFSFRVLNKFIEVLSQNKYFASKGDPYPIHIKLDTGMHRLGFDEKEIPSLLNELENHRSIRVVSIFSHLSSSEDESHDQFTNDQIARFRRMTGILVSGLGYQPILHILNSNGVIRFPQFQMDMVRLGIGLYGLVDDAEHQRKLQSVSRLKTHISQIKEIESGETVGYSRQGVKSSKGKIATIPVGYADGFDRTLGNGNWEVQIGDRLFPTIGKICMDMCMIDLLDASIEEGEEVLVFGGKRSITELAMAMGKSTYEVLTGISSRVKRIYFFE